MATVRRTTEPHRGIAIARMVPEHWLAVRAIYEEGLATGDASFQISAPAWEEFDAAHLPDQRLVALGDKAVIGWAVLSAVSDRCAYAGVAEDSVYVAGAARGLGVGRALLDRLVSDAERAGIWTVQAGIFPENTVSLALHHGCGFRTVGVRERLGRYRGVWRDVLLLERRSGIMT